MLNQTKLGQNKYITTKTTKTKTKIKRAKYNFF